jgi:DNA-binding transcriptional regulator YiaG
MMTEAERLRAVRDLATSGRGREIRESAHLSLADIGRSSGVHYSTVARWERGERLPRGEAALRYLALLDRLAKAAT